MMRFSLLLIFTFLLCSCTENGDVGRPEIIGTYVANHKQGEDRLELKEDGTYKHTFISPQGISQTASHTWKFTWFDNSPWLTINNFKFLWDQTYPIDLGPKWTPPITRTIGGKLRLILDYDMYWYYEKMDKVTGTYIANHDKGKDIIHIKDDGTYAHSFTNLAGKSFNSSNTWNYNLASSRTYIRFNNFQHFSSSMPDPIEEGNWSALLGKSLLSGGKWLGSESDKYHYFEEKLN